jgi:hypothetical protein
MSLFTKIEELSEKIIEGFFKTKFAGDIQPIEIAKKLAREMSDHKAISVSRVYVPNVYQVLLSPEDLEKIKAVEAEVREELQNYLKERARSKNYTLSHEPSITFFEDMDIKKGNFSVASKFTLSPSGLKNKEDKPKDLGEQEIGSTKREDAKQHTQIFENLPIETKEFIIPLKKRAELVIVAGDDEGMAFLLTSGKKIIGRRPTNDIFINDPNVSRQHAQIEDDGEDFIITDFDSTNGTYVNGSRIHNHRLVVNDRIKIGNSVLEFRVVR